MDTLSPERMWDKLKFMISNNRLINLPSEQDPLLFQKAEDTLKKLKSSYSSSPLGISSGSQSIISDLVEQLQKQQQPSTLDELGISTNTLPPSPLSSPSPSLFSPPKISRMDSIGLLQGEDSAAPYENIGVSAALFVSHVHDHHDRHHRYSICVSMIFKISTYLVLIPSLDVWSRESFLVGILNEQELNER